MLLGVEDRSTVYMDVYRYFYDVKIRDAHADGVHTYGIMFYGPIFMVCTEISQPHLDITLSLSFILNPNI